MKKIALAALFAASLGGAQMIEIEGLRPPSRLPAPGEGEEWLGKPAPDWGRLKWTDKGQKLRLKHLRGRVVLLRWWTDGCLYCVDSAPVLNQLFERYGSAGLAVVGMYHPKPPRKVDPEGVREAAELLGFRFPVALDLKWKALDRYWDRERAFTSVSFLIDKEGTIRWVHSGGTYSEAQARELEGKVRELLAAPRATGR